MDNKQLLRLAKDIQQAGLSNNKIAKELMSEIQAHLKTSGLQKKAMFGDPSPMAFKGVYQYWILAALSKLKEQGAVELLTIDIPQPTNGQNIFAYVDQTMKSGGDVRVRRRRLEKAEPAEGSIGQVVNKVWSVGQKSFVKEWNGVPKLFREFYRKETEFYWERALGRASEWAFAASGHNTATTATGRDSTRTKVWASIQENTTSTGNLISDVINAIDLGVWDAVKNKLSWQSPEAKADEEAAIGLSMSERIKRPDEYDKEIDKSIQDQTSYQEMIKHIARSMGLSWSEAEEQYAKELAEEAKALAEAEVKANPAQQVDDKELQDALNNLKVLEVELGALRQMSQLLEDEDYHWLFDSHIYITQWPDFYQNFDAEAMMKLDALIKQSGQKNIAIALKALVHINSTDRLKALTHFIENCMDKTLVSTLLTGKPGVSYLLWLSIKASGGYTFKNQGVSKTIPADSAPFPSGAYWSGVRKILRGITPDETEDFKAGLKRMLESLAPVSVIAKAKTIDSTLEHIVKMSQKDKPAKSDISNLVKGTTGQYDGPRGLFYSVVASEIIRYRYYMDLDLADLKSDPLVPNNLGEPACDNSVRLLIPEMPSQILNTLKQQVVEDHTLPNWSDAVSIALEKHIKAEEALKKSVLANAKKLIEALKEKDSKAEKQARLRIAQLVRNR